MRQVFASRLKETEADLAVIEGVMGYYDGIGAVSKRASSWEISVMTGTPSVLILDCKGASVSLAAQVKGFADFVDNSNIRGVILNRLSPMLYGRLKPVIEKTGIKVYGYLPEMKECSLKSRHLGLFMPGEIEGLREKIGLLAEQIEKKSGYGRTAEAGRERRKRAVRRFFRRNSQRKAEMQKKRYRRRS